MKKARKAVAILMVLCMVFMVGCSGESAKPKDNEPPTSTGSDNFPTKPIELIVPYAPGGQTDLASRALAKTVSKYLPNNQQIVVINLPGASGMTGANEFFNSPADGYRILMTTNSPVTLFPTTEDVDYSFEDIVPMMQVITMPQMMQVKEEGCEWEDGNAWIESYKKSGETFKYGTVGLGNGQHLSVEAFARASGMKTEPVSFPGMPEGRAAVLQGSIDGQIGAPINYDPAQIRLMVCFSGERSKLFPEIPTIKELGVDYSVEFFVGLVAKAGTPQNRIDILNEAFKKALEDPETIEVIEKIPMEMAYLGPKEFGEYMEWERGAYGDLLKELGFVD